MKKERSRGNKTLRHLKSWGFGELLNARGRRLTVIRGEADLGLIVKELLLKRNIYRSIIEGKRGRKKGGGKRASDYVCTRS